MPDSRDEQEWMFQNHPDLTDERWAKKAEKRAFRQIRKARAKARGKGLRPPRAGTFTEPVPAERVIRARTIVLVVVVLVGSLLVAKHPWTGNPSAAQDTTVTPRVQPLDLAHPFALTPAAHWSDGEDGIQPPVAKPEGRYTATQVATALRQTKAVLVAAHLDPKLLFNHDTSGYLALLAPQARAQEGQLLDRQPGIGRVTFLAKGFQLLPVPVKVNGSMSAAVSGDGGLVVHTNYVFAFPFAPRDPRDITEPWQIIAVQHVVEDFDAADDGLYVASSDGYTSFIACTSMDRGYVAPVYSEPTMDAPDGHRPAFYYDPRSPVDLPDGCPHR